MDAQGIFNIAIAVSGFLAGWILRVIWSEIKEMQVNQREIEKEINDNYVRRDDYRIDIAEVKGMLGRIFDRLDRQTDSK
jgi:hypothetical protein